MSLFYRELSPPVFIPLCASQWGASLVMLWQSCQIPRHMDYDVMVARGTPRVLNPERKTYLSLTPTLAALFHRNQVLLQVERDLKTAKLADMCGDSCAITMLMTRLNISSCVDWGLSVYTWLDQTNVLHLHVSSRALRFEGGVSSWNNFSCKTRLPLR